MSVLMRCWLFRGLSIANEECLPAFCVSIKSRRRISLIIVTSWVGLVW